MDVTPIINRLRTQCPSLRAVLPALASATPPAYPVAYVLQLAETPVSETLDQVPAMYTARIGVDIVVKRADAAATGGGAVDGIEDVRTCVIDALAGYAPDAQHRIAYAGGKLLEYDPGYAIWRDEFTVSFVR